MRGLRNLMVAVVCLVVTAFAAAPRTVADHESTREVSRLRAHFDTVLRELRMRDIGALLPSQRAARQQLIARLEEYAAAGRFPHNHVRAGEFVPVFRDEHGTLCAMAFLIASTGRTDIVDDVARASNLALIPELDTDARFTRWLDSVGLTIEEAARIQPMYLPDPCSVCNLDNNDHKRVRYVAFSAGMTATSATLVLASLEAGPGSAKRARVTGWLGLLAGGAQGVYGASAMKSNDPRRPYGYVNLALSGATIAASAWRLKHLPGATPVVATSVSLSPYVSPEGHPGLVLIARR